MTCLRKIFALVLLLCTVASVFSGCHGAVERNVFEIPEEFDESRNYEITFGQKTTLT